MTKPPQYLKMFHQLGKRSYKILIYKKEPELGTVYSGKMLKDNKKKNGASSYELETPNDAYTTLSLIGCSKLRQEYCKLIG